MVTPNNREPLTSAVCQKVVIKSTPRPQDFPVGGDPAVVLLFDLGVVDAPISAVYVQAVKKNLPTGWSIKEQDIAAAPNTSIQAARISIQTHAS